MRDSSFEGELSANLLFLVADRTPHALDVEELRGVTGRLLSEVRALTALDQGTRDRIGFVLRSWLTSTRPMPAGFRALAREAGVLPVVSGWMESHGLRIDGEVVRWSSHPDIGASDVLIEPDARRRRWVLFQASRRFPELADLAPQRPGGAADCARCDAMGRDPELRDAAADGPTECLRCGGMGWFLPEELGEPSRWHGED